MASVLSSYGGTEMLHALVLFLFLAPMVIADFSNDTTLGGDVSTQLLAEEEDLGQSLLPLDDQISAPEEEGSIQAPAGEPDEALAEEEVILESNTTLTETNSSSSSSENASRVFAKRVVCLTRNETAVEGADAEVVVEEPTVSVVNGSAFLYLLSEQIDSNVTNRSMPAQCSLGFFFATWCPFSARAAPHFNGLARLFPDIKMLDIDTGKYHGINTQFGVMALPSVILFHNSKPSAKYNLSEYEVEHFARYLTLFTGLEPKGDLNLTEADFEGPIPTKEVPEPDYYLVLSWVFTIVCALCYFGKSTFCTKIIESVRNTWREAEMHEHQE